MTPDAAMIERVREYCNTSYMSFQLQRDLRALIAAVESMREQNTVMRQCWEKAERELADPTPTGGEALVGKLRERASYLHKHFGTQGDLLHSAAAEIERLKDFARKCQRRLHDRDDRASRVQR